MTLSEKLKLATGSRLLERIASVFSQQQQWLLPLQKSRYLLVDCRFKMGDIAANRRLFRIWQSCGQRRIDSPSVRHRECGKGFIADQ